MSKITLKLEKLNFFGFHGVNQDEIKKGQNFILDLFIEYLPNCNVDSIIQNSDNLGDYIDYIELYSLVKFSFNEKRFNLIEALGSKIIEDIKEKYESILYIRLTIRKPSIIIDDNEDFVNVEIEYKK